MPRKSSHAKTLLWLFGTLLAAWLCCQLYLYFGDVHIRFLDRRVTLQNQWAAHFPTPPARIIFTGGSSCTFSIDAERMTSQFGTPTINAGLEAGMGSAGILLYASRLALPGDTLIIALEPGGLSDPPTFPTDTLRLILFRRDWALLRRSREIVGEDVPLLSLFFSARPGLDGFAATLGRLITHTPFRYDTAQVNASSFMTTSFRPPLTSSLGTPIINPGDRAMLIHFRTWATQNKIRVIYSLPWCYVPSDNLVTQRRDNAQFLLALSEILPVLRDKALGAQSQREMFSDTAWHLSETTAEVRSALLMQEIQHQEFWTRDELLAAAQPPDPQPPIKAHP